jgi:hypothetical protein
VNIFFKDPVEFFPEADKKFDPTKIFHRDQDRDGKPDPDQPDHDRTIFVVEKFIRNDGALRPHTHGGEPAGIHGQRTREYCQRESGKPAFFSIQPTKARLTRDRPSMSVYERL